MTSVTLLMPDTVVEDIAQRAAIIVLAELARRELSSPYLTVAEAAEVLRAKPQRVYDLCDRGALPRVKDGTRLLIRRDDLDAYLERSR